MGEAKRRKKRDPNYGQVPNLSTNAALKHHAGLLAQDFQREFSSLAKEEELKRLDQNGVSESELSEVMGGSWLQQKLLAYAPKDRSRLATVLFLYLFDPEDISSQPDLSETTAVKLLVMMFLPWLEPQMKEMAQEMLDWIEKRMNQLTSY